MIETVYSEARGEDECVKIPKNIHQIGSGETKCHIYIEDKVSEFLALLPENEKDIRYGVLLGSMKFFKGERYLFIDGMVEVRDVLENTILFGDDIWTGIYENIKKYYKNEKIVGWYASLEEVRERDIFQFRKIHLDHFAGNDKVFLNIDRVEGEKEFFVYNNGDLEKVKCYHIYYEKNPDVERYVCETHYDLMCKRPETKVKTSGMKRQGKTGAEAAASAREGQAMPQEVAEDGNEPDITGESDWYQPLIRFANKAVAVFVIGALLFTFGTMYKQGQFHGITEDLKSVVAGIMNKDSQTNMDGIVLINETSGQSGETAESPEQSTDAEETSAQGSAVSVAPEELTTLPVVNAEQETGVQEEITTAVPEEAAIVPVTTHYYTVEKGDTLYGICVERYGNTDNIEVIMQLNDLESADSIYIGKTLIVP